MNSKCKRTKGSGSDGCRVLQIGDAAGVDTKSRAVQVVSFYQVNLRITHHGYGKSDCANHARHRNAARTIGGDLICSSHWY